MKPLKTLVLSLLVLASGLTLAAAQAPTLGASLTPDYARGAVSLQLQVAGATPRSTVLMFYAAGTIPGLPMGSEGTLFLDPATLRLLLVLSVGRSGSVSVAGDLTQAFPDFTLPLQALVIDPNGNGAWTNNIGIGQQQPDDPDCNNLWFNDAIIDSDGGLDTYEFTFEGDPGTELTLKFVDQSLDQKTVIEQEIIPASGELIISGGVNMNGHDGDMLELYCNGNGIYTVGC